MKNYLCLLLIFFGLTLPMAQPLGRGQVKLTANDGAASDYFGYSVSISEDYAIVGAPQDNENSGSAYIFNCVGTSWNEQIKLTANDAAAGDWFGSVSINGDYAIVGAYRNNNNGAAYIFKRDETTWSQQAKLTANDAAAGDWFGLSVSINGNYAIVGAHGDDDESGSAYIFKRDGTTWSQQAKLTANDAAAGDEFGLPVSINGDYAIVGAIQNSIMGPGAAYIFKRVGDSWTQQIKLFDSNGASQDRFGHSVSINGDYAIVGVLLDDDNGQNSGTVFIFKREEETWYQYTKITGEAADSRFGKSVSIEGNCLAIGAAELAYIYKLSGSTWAQQIKIIPDDGEVGDQFGDAISISGSYTIVGAIHHNQTGAAYVVDGVDVGSAVTVQIGALAAPGRNVNEYGIELTFAEDQDQVRVKVDWAQESAYLRLRRQYPAPTRETVNDRSRAHSIDVTYKNVPAGTFYVIVKHENPGSTATARDITVAFSECGLPSKVKVCPYYGDPETPGGPLTHKITVATTSEPTSFITEDPTGAQVIHQSGMGTGVWEWTATDTSPAVTTFPGLVEVSWPETRK